jgi:hypothetical protein
MTMFVNFKSVCRTGSHRSIFYFFSCVLCLKGKGSFSIMSKRQTSIKNFFQLKNEPESQKKDQIVIESHNQIVNNIKHEKPVEFVLILPRREIKIENDAQDDLLKKKTSKFKGRSPGPFKCQLCPQSFRLNCYLRCHEVQHKPKTECEVCGKKIAETRIKTHMKVHEKNVEKFQCDHCRFSFFEKGRIYNHMVKHRKFKRFHCKPCNRGFHTTTEWNIHQLRHSENSRPFKCDICPKGYADKVRLKVHMLSIHLKLKNFSCKTCSFQTYSQTSLSRHAKSHERIFACITCQRTFECAATLRQHRRTHMIINCQLCDSKFAFKSDLKYHMRSVCGKN